MFPHINELKLSQIRTRFQSLTFIANLDVNKYVFNEKKVLFNALPNALYVIDKLSFGASVEQNQFTAALNEFITLQFKRSSTDSSIGNFPYQISQFYGAYDIYLPFKGLENGDGTGEPISIKCDGALNQTADFVNQGINQVKLSLTFKMYEVIDPVFLEKYW